MKERGYLFLVVWIWCLGVSAGLIICGLFLFPRASKVYETVTVDAGPIVITMDQDISQTNGGVIATSRVREIREWVIRVPKYAIRFKNDSAYVLLLNNGNPYDALVSIGVIGDEFAEVVSGVLFGDAIVTNIKK
ncbi:MAG: Efflux transporter, RND family, MFP subunit [Parcubacteria group bacterium GW2011_GWA2_43_13]|nr:MAG: Efflux transporter, RND family, MFP subunit [Parcubacteria group bacterium GW2011_GWA2_43_13]OGY69526.1 MAG: hypothetical protein A3B94_03710 [Candidatus Jacksonbacteria bacterium RIFCSPHIGHO2_02_FULL_43_10]OGY70243.1 MAG: hypothetical protein A2986_04225 [Candidatus Jacksonbacteria bacterium RIFCSPLOWO2_01_FULL_44_13]HAZ16990.1 hypothetical protein [Candidatus Jacksonbacteria bacterium]